MTISKARKQRDLTEQCPHCYTYDVSGDLVDHGHDDIHREMSCENCYADWEIPYTACEWVSVSEPINPIPDPDRHVVHLRTTSYFSASRSN